MSQASEQNELGHVGKIIWAAPPNTNRENSFFSSRSWKPDTHPEGMEEGCSPIIWQMFPLLTLYSLALTLIMTHFPLFL